MIVYDLLRPDGSCALVTPCKRFAAVEYWTGRHDMQWRAREWSQPQSPTPRHDAQPADKP